MREGQSDCEFLIMRLSGEKGYRMRIELASKYFRFAIQEHRYPLIFHVSCSFCFQNPSLELYSVAFSFPLDHKKRGLPCRVRGNEKFCFTQPTSCHDIATCSNK